MTTPNVLVIGARHHSLGWHIGAELVSMGVPATLAGIATEPIHLDCTSTERMHDVFHNFEPTHVICTVGRNEGMPVYHEDFLDNAQETMEVNYLAPMRALKAFEAHLAGMPGTFIAISSNSAHIPRTSSAAYCASKAALSMGLRCAARDLSRAGAPMKVWGYEPGALMATPMTKAVQNAIGEATPMSRMLTHPQGLNTRQVARMVARDAVDASGVLHGCMVRLDNGEI